MSTGDGLAIDTAGRLYSALPACCHPETDTQGVRVISPQGRNLGIIPTVVPPSSVAFAGPDKKTLYIVGRRNGLQKVQMIAQGIKGRAK
jgi:gluconolactonase